MKAFPVSDSLIYEKAFTAIQFMRLGDRILEACRKAAISRAQLLELASKDDVVGAALKVAENEADDILAESLADAREWGAFGAQDPKVAAVWAKNVQWLLAKRNPARYGDKIVVEQRTTVDVIITSRLEAAKTRILALTPPVQDADFSEITE